MPPAKQEGIHNTHRSIAMSEETNEENENAEQDSDISRPSNPLSRSTDQTIRPGFRNPANARSKATKKKKNRKKKR